MVADWLVVALSLAAGTTGPQGPDLECDSRMDEGLNKNKLDRFQFLMEDGLVVSTIERFCTGASTPNI